MQTPTMNDRFEAMTADRKAQYIKRAGEVSPEQVAAKMQNTMLIRWAAMRAEATARFPQISM